MIRRGRVSMVRFRKPRGRPLPTHHAGANAGRSTVRSVVEHVLASQHRMKLFVRTVGLVRAKVKVGMANPACNFSRLARLDARATSARSTATSNCDQEYPTTQAIPIIITAIRTRKSCRQCLTMTFLEASDRARDA